MCLVQFSLINPFDKGTVTEKREHFIQITTEPATAIEYSVPTQQNVHINVQIYKGNGADVDVAVSVGGEEANVSFSGDPIIVFYFNESLGQSKQQKKVKTKSIWTKSVE